MRFTLFSASYGPAFIDSPVCADSRELGEGLFEPSEYCRLAATPDGRALAYLELFKQPLAMQYLEAIRVHLNKDCALGSSKFQDDIEAMLGGGPELYRRDDERKRNAHNKNQPYPFSVKNT